MQTNLNLDNPPKFTSTGSFQQYVHYQDSDTREILSHHPLGLLNKKCLKLQELQSEMFLGSPRPPTHTNTQTIEVEHRHVVLQILALKMVRQATK